MKNQQSSRTVVLSLHLLVIFITIITKIEARSLLQSSSSCSSSCGDIPQITYPFRLKNDPASCGDPEYELTCESNKTFLNFLSTKYLVTKISYDKHILRAVDMKLANGTCNLPSRPLDLLDMYSDSRFISNIQRKYARFLRCSYDLVNTNTTTVTTGSAGYSAYRSVPCESRNGSYVFVQYGDYYEGLGSIPDKCREISVIPGDYVNGTNLSYEEIVKVLQGGFDMGWSVECRNCQRTRYGNCQITTFQPPYLYRCNIDGDAQLAEDVRLISGILNIIWLSLIGVSLVARYILFPIVIIAFLIHRCRNKA